MEKSKESKRFKLFKKTEKGKSTNSSTKTPSEEDSPPTAHGKTDIEESNCSADSALNDLPDHRKPGFLQQDNSVKQFYLDIGDKGLRYAWAKYYEKVKDPKKFARTKTESPKHIIIVGAGFAGLSAAFELQQVGHKTTILELQYRVGGRAKTMKHGLSEGLHSEGGAMRLPLQEHYLVNHYIKSFDVPVRGFQNENDEAYINLFGHNIKLKEWSKNNLQYLSQFYPDAAIFIMKHGLTSIDELYQHTIEPVIKELQNNDSQEGWSIWVGKWSKYSVESFLLEQNELNEAGLRPWPQDAIQAYKVTTYSPFMTRSLVEILRDEIGQWWSSPLSEPKAGMQAFAERFTDQAVGWNSDVFLSRNIQFGKRVERLRIDDDGASVFGKNTSTGQEFVVKGDALIVTTTLPILRQMTIEDETSNKNFFKIQKVISDIHYEASTKIFLQCKSRFWEKDIGNGGFSKTNLPIGQLHYPSKEDVVPNTERAVLMCYSWGTDGVMLGAQPEEVAVASAVRQVKNIHPEIEDEFEVGCVQAWTADESTQLAFALFNPYQYDFALETLLGTDTHPLYVAGEAISWFNGWIQGALESGLAAAYEIFCKFEPRPT